jgi:hypothetical protein
VLRKVRDIPAEETDTHAPYAAGGASRRPTRDRMRPLPISSTSERGAGA